MIICASHFGLRGRILAEIKRIYGEAGWDIVYRDDQRDGDYVEFTPKGGGCRYESSDRE